MIPAIILQLQSTSSIRVYFPQLRLMYGRYTVLGQANSAVLLCVVMIHVRQSQEAAVCCWAVNVNIDTHIMECSLAREDSLL